MRETATQVQQTGRLVPEETIDCIDCGGRCHLLTTWPADDPPMPGDILVYRCEDCLDRWDIVIPEDGP
jgi:hypothetical protein